MSTVKEILDATKNERLREEAVDALRRRTKRNTPAAILYFSLALFYLWQAYRQGVSEKVEGKSVILADGMRSVGLALIWIYAGVERVWVRPRDRLLLMLGEDMLASRKEPNKAAQTTPGPTFER
jgi:hypothetical protein